MNKCFLLIGTWLSFYVCRAQLISHAPPEVFTFQNGLPDVSINSLAQDEDGYLWIGTTNGLSRYDGSEFINYYHHAGVNSIPGNNIISLMTLPGHSLLIATTSGLSVLQTRTGVFNNRIITSSNEMFAFNNYYLSIAVDSQHTIWAGTKMSLYHLDDQLNTLEEFRGMVPGDVNKERLKYAQKIIVLGNGKILAKLQTKEKTAFYQYDDGLKKMIAIDETVENPLHFLSNVSINNIIKGEGNDFFYMKFNTDSIFHYLASQHSSKSISIPALSKPDEFSYNSELFKLPSGQIFCSLSNGGMIQLNNSLSKNAFLSDSKKEILLREKMIYCLQTDSDNNLWVGTNNGLYKYSFDKIYVQTFTLIPKNIHRSFEAGTIRLINNNFFIASSGAGFFIKSIEGNDWKNIEWPGKPGWKYIWDINKTNGPDTFWVGTQAGLCWWDIKNDTHGGLLLNGVPSVIDSVPVTTQFIDHKNQLWMGAGFGNGVVVYDMKKHLTSFYSSSASINPLPIRHPTAITEDIDGNIWMGGQDGTGLVELKNNAGQFTIFHPLYNTSFDNGIIYTLFGDRDGNVWIGTVAGLVKWDIHKNIPTHKFDISSGLSSNIIYTCCADSMGHLWLGTSNGLNCIDLNKNQVIKFHDADYFAREAITGMIYDRVGKRLYFTTPQTVTSIVPAELLRPIASPKIIITSILSSGRALNYNKNLQLSYDENNLTIYFTGVNLSNGFQNNYYYQLAGISDKWIGLGHQRVAGFYHLPPGKYVFTVRAQTANGNWSSNDESIAFTILTPYWKTWWFIGIIILIIASIVYMGFKYRIRQLIILQKVRTRISTDLHDDIGSTLTNIHILTELSQHNLEKPQEASIFLKRISEEIGNSSQALDDIVWSINTKNDSMEQIVTRMRRYAAEIFDKDNIIYSLHLDEKLIHKKLGMELRRDIYLIFKELINNIYKHAQAKKVTIKIFTEKSNLQIRIEDDGFGFEPTMAVNRNGLKNINSRVNKWKGSCNIQSRPGMGTVIEINIPVM